MSETQENYRIAVIGPGELVAGFRAAGLTVLSAENGQAALDHLRQIKQQATEANSHFGAVFIVDFLMTEIPEDEYRKVTNQALPAVITIPGLNADPEAGSRKLRRLTEKAIGFDILSGQ